MVDKVMAVHLSRCGRKIGVVSELDLQTVDRALGIVLGLVVQSPTNS
jgi:hypothetical protein